MQIPKRHEIWLFPGAWMPRLPPEATETPLYKLLEFLYDRVKACWEEHFEDRYGFWRGLVDGVVARHLDCGIPVEAPAGPPPRACHGTATTPASLPPPNPGRDSGRIESRFLPLRRFVPQRLSAPWNRAAEAGNDTEG